MVNSVYGCCFDSSVDQVSVDGLQKWGLEMSDEEQKKIIKEALKEWLDEKYATLGKWTLHGLLAMALGAIALLIMYSQGWHK